MNSIITKDPAHCYLCGEPATQIHHVLFGSGKRKLADEDGLTVPLCMDCHAGVHKHYELQNFLKQVGQMAFEKTRSRDEFMKRYGRNYL